MQPQEDFGLGSVKFSGFSLCWNKYIGQISEYRVRIEQGSRLQLVEEFVTICQKR